MRALRAAIFPTLVRRRLCVDIRFTVVATCRIKFYRYLFSSLIMPLLKLEQKILDECVSEALCFLIRRGSFLWLEGSLKQNK